MFKKENLYKSLVKKSIFIGFILFYQILSTTAYADNIQIQWTDNLKELDFKNASYSSKYQYLPFYSIQKNGKFEVEKFQALQTRKISSVLFH
jgi:hypothetical protein